MTEKMTITQEKKGSWNVMKVAGRIDTVTAPEAETAAMAELAGCNQFAVDLSALEYISSAGLRTLLRLAKQAQQDNKKFVLAGVNGLVKEVLEESGMDSLFTVCENLDFS